MSGYLRLKNNSEKTRAKAKGLQPEGLLGIQITYSVWMQLFPNLDCTVVSITDGKHSKNSLHYKGQAFDLRTNTIKESADKHNLLSKLKRCLGKDYDVLLEGEFKSWEHIHVEYDPK